MVPRNEVASKPGHKREAGTSDLFGFRLFASHFCSHYRLKNGFAAAHAYAALKVWAMDYAEGKSTGQVLTCPLRRVELQG